MADCGITGCSNALHGLIVLPVRTSVWLREYLGTYKTIAKFHDRHRQASSHGHFHENKAFWNLPNLS